MLTYYFAAAPLACRHSCAAFFQAMPSGITEDTGVMGTYFKIAINPLLVRKIPTLRNWCDIFIASIRQSPPPLPKLRRAIALKLINEYGESLAETARRLGISKSGVAQILRRSGYV